MSAGRISLRSTLEDGDLVGDADDCDDCDDCVLVDIGEGFGVIEEGFGDIEDDFGDGMPADLGGDSLSIFLGAEEMLLVLVDPEDLRDVSQGDGDRRVLVDPDDLEGDGDLITGRVQLRGEDGSGEGVSSSEIFTRTLAAERVQGSDFS